MLPNGDISMFDDEAGPPMKAPSSRGLVLRLDLRRRRAALVRQYRAARGHLRPERGQHADAPPVGNVFVGFGAQPFFSEFSSKGRMLFDASLPQDDGSYRAYRFPWKATPRTRPDVAARRSGPTAVSVYASWNGATDVVRWQVLAGQSATSLAPVSSAARSDFETRIDVTSAATTFAVRALGAKGRVLATSAPVSAG